MSCLYIYTDKNVRCFDCATFQIQYSICGVLIQTECQNYNKKKAIRIILCGKCNAHTEPMFKGLNLLKVDDIFTCQCMSFYHKYVNTNVPLFCKSLFTCNATQHEYHTRHNLQLVIPYSHTSRAIKSVRYDIPSLLRSIPQCVIEKVHTRSLNGFSLYSPWARQNIGTTQGGKTSMVLIYLLDQYKLRNM